jgi:outer membrane protein TolC
MERAKKHTLAVIIGLVAVALCAWAAAGEEPPAQGPPEAAPEGGPAATQEGEQAPPSLTLLDCFRVALKANKDVIVASLDEQAAEARIMGAKGAFDPVVFMEASRGRTKLPAGSGDDPTDTADGTVTAGVRTRIVTGTDVELSASTDYTRDLTHTADPNPQYAPDLSLVLRQDLLKDFGVGVNRTDIVVSQNNWEISKEQLRDAVIQNLFAVENAYWDLYYAVEDLKVRREQLKRAETLVARAEAQAKVGVSANIEVTRARSSAASQAVSILQAENNVSLLRHRLLRVMGVLDEGRLRTGFVLADSPPEELHRASLAESLSVALRTRPEYIQAGLSIDNAALQERFARNQRLPTLQLFGEVSLAGLDERFGPAADDVERGRYTSWEAGLSFEWPIPNRTARSRYRVAQLARLRARTQREAVVEQITREVADALDDLETAEGRIKSAQEARDLAQQLLRAEEKSFSLGRSDGTDVLNAQAALANAERDEVRARSDYAIALANLYRTQGDFLEQKSIAFVEQRDALRQRQFE